MQRILFNFVLALEGVFANKLRAMLTALGIVFGVGAVIAMLAIGTGAKKDILDQMKLVGTNNIVIEPVKAIEEENNNTKDSKIPYSPGLTMKDVDNIQALLVDIETISPEIVLNVNAVRAKLLKKIKCVGVKNSFFDINNLQLQDGTLFHPYQEENGLPVCIIGQHIKTKFFNQTDPIGKKIKCGKTWLTVIGVLQNRFASKKNIESLGIRDYNSDVYIPLKTTLLRFKNRASISKKDLKEEQDRDDDEEANQPVIIGNYHQIDRLVVRLARTETLQASADIIARLLKRRHQDVIDFEVKVPELLIQQQQKTQDTFNLVLSAIAGISLLVGGIGIMNIMLASVLERIKEIGLRRSLGATRIDIILQFLFEAIFISLLGGIIGIVLGVTSAKGIAEAADIPTIVSTWSVLLSFGVAASIGLIFGLLPARKAALLDPIKALRQD